MLPHFSNPTALWVLLSIPAIIAIHFLRYKAKKQLTATLFLLQAMAPEDTGGRAWDRLLASRAFWLQITAALLLTWVMLSPVFPREHAGQTVVFVLDESADMAPFRSDAVAAIERDMNRIAADGIPTTWILMGTRPTGLTFYNGEDKAAALDALCAWQPGKNTHPFDAALRTANALAGKNGISRLISNRAQRVPPGQAAIGVGRPLNNLGFAGITGADRSLNRHKISVINRSSSPAAPTVTITAGAEPPVTTQLPPIAPNAITEFTFEMPRNSEHAVLSLPTDDFTADNTLLLSREAPIPVKMVYELNDKEAAVFRRIADGLPGFSTRAPDTARCITLTRQAQPNGCAIVIPTGATPMNGMITAERHPLTDGLNWNGLLIPGIGNMRPANTAEILLWLGSHPLAWLDKEKLYLNWPWAESNADRIPATLLMTRRYMQSVQDASPGTHYGNLPAGSLYPLKNGHTVSITTPDGLTVQRPWAGRLPEQSALVSIHSADKNEPPLFKGAVWFADAAMGDFSDCAVFDTGLPDRRAEIKRQLKPDPLTPLWLLLIALCLLGSWWPITPNRLPRS